jgi:hypothetical protein
MNGVCTGKGYIFLKDDYNKDLTSGLSKIGHSPSTAVADIIDNSIDAKAKNIGMYFWDGKHPHVAFVDDGHGMSHDEILRAFDIKSSTNSNDASSSKLGKFGWGLKSASFSQCDKITIISKKNNQINFKTMDLNFSVIETNLVHIFSKYPSLEKIFQKRCPDQGTLLIWEELKNSLTGFENSSNNQHTVFFRNGLKIAEDVSLHFHNFLSNINFSFNDRALKKWDPFNFFNINVKIFDKKIIVLNNSDVEIQGFLFPMESDFNSKEEYENVGGKNGWFNSQGIYIYREERLVNYGGWFGLQKGPNPWQKEEKYKRCRFSLKYKSTNDDNFITNVKKADSIIPNKIRHQVADYCDVVRKEAIKRKTSTILKNFDLIKDDHDLLVCNNSGEVVINLEHINIKNLITNQLSKSKKEFIIDQLSRQIKKFTNSSAK